jgi:hypothetical protein
LGACSNGEDAPFVVRGRKSKKRPKAPRRLERRLAATFRANSDFPIETAATFPFIPGVSWSDHRSFWRQGYRAVMITDTAFYRYRHYHAPSDTPDKLAYPELTRFKRLTLRAQAIVLSARWRRSLRLERQLELRWIMQTSRHRCVSNGWGLARRCRQPLRLPSR